MTAYLLVFLAGAAGSMHCIGMCGGFACAIGGDARGPAASVLRHALYNVGRLSSYAFIGALVGSAGLLLVGPGGGTGTAAQRALAVVSGLLMVYIGLQFLGWLETARAHGPGVQALAQALRTLVRAPARSAPLAMGVLNGLLPCPLVYAFAAQAAASGGPMQGLAIMAAFGLGTFPAMLAMGGVGLWLRRAGAAPRAQPIHASFLPAASMPLPRTDWRVLGVRAAGAFIVLLGLVTLARGVLPMSAHAWMGH
jgi:uncharacterized protein